MNPLEHLKWWFTGEVAHWVHEFEGPTEAVAQPLSFFGMAGFTLIGATSLVTTKPFLAAGLAFIGAIMLWGGIVLSAAAVTYYRERTEVPYPGRWSS